MKPNFKPLKYKGILLLALVFLPIFLHSKTPITFVITDVPRYTSKSDTLYLITSFNDWNINQYNYPFKLFADGCYRLTIEISDNTSFEYKINRGNWDKVEGNKWGDFLENRFFHYEKNIFEVKLKVDSWQDLHDEEFPPIKLVVTSVPKNTPHDANIYVTGTFNNWRNNDPVYKLEKQSDGSYFGFIKDSNDSVFYKFTRGNWESIEGRIDGGMRSNRQYFHSEDQNKQIVTTILSWRDLSRGMVWLNAAFLTFFILYIIFLCLTIRFSQSRILKGLIVMLGIGFFSKFYSLSLDISNYFPYPYLIPTILYPAIGPWIYASIKTNISRKREAFEVIQLLPFLPVFWFIKYCTLPAHDFNLAIVNNKFIPFIISTYFYSLILQCIFSIRLKRLISKWIAIVPDTTYRIHRVIQTFWVFSMLIFIVALLALARNIEIKLITEWFENLLWLGMGIVTVNYAFYSLSGLYITFVNSKNKLKKVHSEDDNWALLKSKLTDLMTEKSVYTNPNLTLSDLAGYLGTNNHYISRLINEGLNMSYTDYINSYRIKAFIREMKSDKENSTYLYYAYKVGFNSKSAFYRAFKRSTNKTPGEYFQKKQTPKHI